MTDSQNQEDLEIRILKELTEIRLAMQLIKSDMENSELRFDAAIVKHKSECWKCSEFVRNADFEHKVDVYLINKQKRFIVFAEFIKSIIYTCGLIAAIWYLKK